MKPFVAFCVVLFATNVAVAQDYPRANLLVEVGDVAKNPGFVLLDCRDRAKYDESHLPGAIWVDHAAWSKAFGTEIDPQKWSERIGALGIKPATKVLVYDDALQKDAARTWWILRYFGVQDVRLLNGGWPAWSLAKLPTTKDVPTVTAVKFTAATQKNRYADKNTVLGHVTDKTAQIVDARSEKEYCGETAKAKKAGSILGAVHLEWSDALEPSTQKFKTSEQLKALLKQAGIDVKRPTVTHCQSGGRAAVMAFTLELMGADSVANYYRGWSEWGNVDDTPIAIPKK